MIRNRLLALLPFLLAALAFAPVPSPSSAQGALRATLYIVQGNLPRNLGTVQQLQRFARGHNVRELREITDVPMPQRRWDGTVVTQFSRALGDLEFQMLFFDVTNGQQPRLIGSPMTVMVNNRNENTFVQPIHLERPVFRPNRDVEVVATVRRQEVGRRRFRMVGEVPPNSGEVDFTQPGMN